MKRWWLTNNGRIAGKDAGTHTPERSGTASHRASARARPFAYAPPEVTARIESVDLLVAVRVVEDPARRLHVAEIHATARWVETGRPYVQDYVIWMTLDEHGRIRSWREYWDKGRI